MKTITIELTDAQYKGMEYAAVSPEEWATNALHTRADTAIEDIVGVVVGYCLNNGKPIPQTRDEIVSYGFENGIVVPAVKRNTMVTPDG